ncbi:hypothetical protein DMR_10430 [Solidesulfovibrio magneticus RS-1]|uniref:LysR family transcriptional regulator n=1 Tax=Solidesulfovibrio magneticus (strain ATCC 700980 / DSM 13731 / RS-1) TaxID=573370 RepID=C4XKZ5_SOLM1|nr:hypothetical protein DMR_10430 [Solidesulfovibrio magneticus RS-1]
MIQRNSYVYDLNLLPLFLVLVEQKYVSRTAEAAHVTQSCMSKVFLKARNILMMNFLSGINGRVRTKAI